MAVTITKITRVGGNPPTHFSVEGTVTGCETLHVGSNCTNQMMPVPIPSGGINTWKVDLPNDKCDCGSTVVPTVTVTAYCGLGTPSQTSASISLPVCDNCPTLTITADPPGQCVNGKRSVTFHASVNGVPATGIVLQWGFPYSTQPSTTAFFVTSNGALPDQTVEYAADTVSSLSRTATLQIIFPANCPPTPALPASITVTIAPCPSCCPRMQLDPPTVTGCAPGSTVASFSGVLTVSTTGGCAPVTPTLYTWTLDGPGGQYQRSTSSPNTDTSSPWTDVISGNLVTVQFPSSGDYSISVTAQIPGIDSSCDPTDTKSFFVRACCPQLIGPLNASQKPGDPCTWLFSAQVSNPNNAAVTFEWSFQDGTTATTSLPQVEHPYTPGSITTGTTTVTLKSLDCPDQSLSVIVTHNCFPCPPEHHRNANGDCEWDDCPPEHHRNANGDCEWDDCPPEHHRNANGDCEWDDCPPEHHRNANGDCEWDECPPNQHRDANGNCVPNTSSKGCNIWCVLAGIFLIAIPISAYLSAIAHCFLSGTALAIVTGIITAAIGIFIGLCGRCCLWKFLLIGAALGVIATAIAAYWFGFPNCWFVALPLLIGFVVLAIGIAIDCARSN